MVSYQYDQNQKDSHDVAYSGDKRLGHRLLREYGVIKHWSKETTRARWDGAAALLNWWSALHPASRPPLHQLSPEEARAFISSLEARGLARETIKSYRVGADALIQALRWGGSIPYQEDPSHKPFEGIQPKPKQRVRPNIDPIKVAELPHSRQRAKLEALLALLELSLSISEACEVRWSAIDLTKREVHVGQRRVTLGVTATQALEALWWMQAAYRRDPYFTILAWSPDSARRWLKKVKAG